MGSNVSPMLAVMGFGTLNGPGGAGATRVNGSSALLTNGHAERGMGGGSPFISRPPSSSLDLSQSPLQVPMGFQSLQSIQQFNLAIQHANINVNMQQPSMTQYGGGSPQRRSTNQWDNAASSYSTGDNGRGRHFDHPHRSFPNRHRGYNGDSYDDRPSPLLPYNPNPAVSPSLLSLPPKYPSPSSLLPPSSLALSSPHAAWLDDFRLNKTNSHLTLFDISARGLVLDLACDQFGSRFIQQRLETATADEKSAAFSQLISDVIRLSEDVFGNYVVQKFLEFGSSDQRRAVGVALLGSVHALSLQMYGCRVIQKALDVVDAELQSAMVSELKGHVMQLVRDSNGNHVIQKCIERCSPPVIHFIVDAFQGQISSLSTHPYGCRVIQRLLEHCNDPQRASILAELMSSIDELCRNSYGNYVIQHVLIHGSQSHRSAIVKAIRGKLLLLSKHKFASNVVEKAFAHASKADRDALVDEVLGREGGSGEGSSSAVLIAMVKDQFGNYVIQRLIDVLDEEQRANLVQRIKRYVPSLKKIPYGKHILAKIERATGQQL